jgi:hypothetical protein
MSPPELNQQPTQTQGSKGRRVFTSLLGGAFIGIASGIIAFVIILGLFILFTRLLVGDRAGGESIFFMLLALPFYVGLPVCLVVALLAGLMSSFFIYKKGLSWFNLRDRRTKWLLLGGALLGAVAIGGCALLSLLAYARPILSVLM